MIEIALLFSSRSVSVSSADSTISRVGAQIRSRPEIDARRAAAGLVWIEGGVASGGDEPRIAWRWRAGQDATRRRRTAFLLGDSTLAAKRSRQPREAPAPAIVFFNQWFDSIEHAVRDRVRSFLEELIESEPATVLARPRYGRRAQDDGVAAAAAVRYPALHETATGLLHAYPIAAPVSARLDIIDRLGGRASAPRLAVGEGKPFGPAPPRASAAAFAAPKDRRDGASAAGAAASHAGPRR